LSKYFTVSLAKPLLYRVSEAEYNYKKKDAYYGSLGKVKYILR
jgi:hypothetical protein